MSNEMKPLLSDDDIATYWEKVDDEWANDPDMYDGLDKVDIAESCTEDGMKYTRNLYEADRTKLHALLQTIVDRSQDVINRWDSPKWKWDQHTGEITAALRHAVEKAKSHGIEPSNTKEG